MLKRILIANRGEIAARIIRSCLEMNIETVAVFSAADRGALFTTLATQAVCIGAAPTGASYLNQDAILEAARLTGADAIHPGFGFLSENADFARRVQEAGLTWIGPTPEVIEQLGDKNTAKRIMREHLVPCVPGSDGLLNSPEEAIKLAEEAGYPVLLKATAGGGGKGMREVAGPDELPEAYASAAAEAKAAFGNGDLYLEKLIVNPRHIEVQILGDEQGHIVHLGTRDCTLQRNHQKLVEEAPAIYLAKTDRMRLEQAAVKAAEAVGYSNAGTVEFVVSGSDFYFIEMNTRIQVEHPVTEMLTGVNIVREQIRIASGMPLDFSQDEVQFLGHAIECRINAEDPTHGFNPSPGTIENLLLPSGFGVRVDSVLHQGYQVSPFYDSMIAKIIVHGRSRNEAIARMRRVLAETVIDGVKTTMPLDYMLMYNADYIANRIDTGFIGRNLDLLLRPWGDSPTL
ncbi:MAG: acetyl-CoA carboxylase biotin carboxylase subunit [Coriobacteriales bacterium]|jgi:acetyl-CoA carboxylase biotin carboxylase subunit|nr:acetyl-CoA carboxylase biotin carboxylase subunit [Coriobacteriales bacterium]